MKISSSLNGPSNDSDWQLYEYFIDVTICIPEHEDYQLNQLQIEGMYIEKDFDNDHLPVLLLDVAISVLLEQKIKENASDVTFVLNVTGYIKDVDNPDIPNDQKLVMSGVYTPLIVNTTPDNNSFIRKKIRSANEAEDNDFMLEDLTNKVTYILYKKDMATAVRTIVNNVLPNVNLTTAISYMLSEAGIKKVVMSNLDNAETIPELLLLPIPVLSELIYLNNFYGLHKEGTQIFADFDTFYINRMSGKCTAWEKNEPIQVTFFIGDSRDGESLAKGVIVEDNVVFINVEKDAYELSDKTMAMDQTVANNTILINENDATSSTVDTGGKFAAVKSTVGHNQYLESIIQIRQKENACTITLMVDNIDISVLTPNKQYNFITTNTEIIDDVKGSYRLCVFGTTFIREATHYYPSTFMVLKRIPEE